MRVVGQDALILDTDNALGSPHGDVDDAFALAALLRSGLPVAGLASVGGNTSEARADRNNRRLAALCGFSGPFFRGVEAGEVPDRIDRAPELWSGAPVRVVALGPLTNLAAVLRRGSARWLRRSRLLRWSSTFPAFDLLAAACVIAPSLVDVEETTARVHSNLWISYGRGGRPVRLVRGFDGEAVWRRCASLINEGAGQF